MAKDALGNYIDALHEKMMAAEASVSPEGKLRTRSYNSGYANGLRAAYELLEKTVLADFVGRK